MAEYVFNHPKRADAPRVVVVGLASCFGCQLQITNIEQHLMAVLGQIELVYWQLTVDEPMPDEFDVAIIEGVVNTTEAIGVVKQLRDTAKKVIAIGACATTGGIPGITGDILTDDAQSKSPCATVIAPQTVSSVIEVDFEVPCCPIDPYEFLDTLSAALYGSNVFNPTKTLCGECKLNETMCFYAQQKLCLGLVTKAGCGARCVHQGRSCNGCRGVSPDANLDSAREIVKKFGIDQDSFDKSLELFNQVNPVMQDMSSAQED